MERETQELCWDNETTDEMVALLMKKDITSMNKRGFNVKRRVPVNVAIELFLEKVMCKFYALEM